MGHVRGTAHGCGRNYGVHLGDVGFKVRDAGHRPIYPYYNGCAQLIQTAGAPDGRPYTAMYIIYYSAGLNVTVFLFFC
jgi:hypothetical protein